MRGFDGCSKKSDLTIRRFDGGDFRFQIQRDFASAAIKSNLRVHQILPVMKKTPKAESDDDGKHREHCHREMQDALVI